MHRLTLNLSLALALSASPFLTPARGAERSCAEILARPLARIEKAFATAGNDANVLTARETLALYQAAATDPAFLKLLPPKRVIPLLMNGEAPYFIEQLQVLLAHYQTSEAKSVEARLQEAVTKALTGRVPATSIAPRVAQIASGKKQDFLRALGDMTFEETQILLHGGDPLHPSPESLIGQYLEATGAATLIRRFTQVPNDYLSPIQGPERLVIAVSESSFGEYARLLLRPELFGVHAHALVSTNRLLFSYQHTGVEYRLPSPGYLLPQVLLKPTEAQRLKLFFDLNSYELRRGMSYGEQNRAMHPWSIPGYCQRGAYVNCTHWIGNLPLGDERSSEIELPAGNEAVGATGIRSTLAAYESDEPVLSRVWKSPTHASLSQLLGVHEHNMRGDMASPGYVIHTLLGEAIQARVPFAVLVVPDHTVPIPPNFLYTVEEAH